MKTSKEHIGWNEINGVIIEPLIVDSGVLKHHVACGPCQERGVIYETYQLLNRDDKAVVILSLCNGSYKLEKSNSVGVIGDIFVDQWLADLRDAYLKREKSFQR